MSSASCSQLQRSYTGCIKQPVTTPKFLDKRLGAFCYIFQCRPSLSAVILAVDLEATSGNNCSAIAEVVAQCRTSRIFAFELIEVALLTQSFQVISENIAINHILQKLYSLTYISLTDRSNFDRFDRT